jgi:hypothetical protein
MPHPTKRSALACLNKKRLIGLAAEFEVAVAQAEPKAAFVEALAHSKSASFSKLLEALPATELRLICRAHELAISGAKAALVGRIRGDEAGGAAQTSLLGGAEDEAGEEALAAVFARAVPSIAGLVPLLNQRELAAVLRRLEERHHVAIDLTGVVGVDGLAAALTPRLRAADAARRARPRPARPGGRALRAQAPQHQPRGPAPCHPRRRRRRHRGRGARARGRAGPGRRPEAHARADPRTGHPRA